MLVYLLMNILVIMFRMYNNITPKHIRVNIIAASSQFFQFSSNKFQIKLPNHIKKKNYINGIIKVIFGVKCIFKDIFGYSLEHICMVLSAFKSGPLRSLYISEMK